MHIFVADERPLMVLANTRRYTLQIARCAGFCDIWRQKRGSGERHQVAAVLRFPNFKQVSLHRTP